MAEGMSILLVDNDPVVIKSYERVLGREGYNVEGAAGGKEAITAMEQKSYDLVVTDLKMPEVDGIALVKWVKKNRPDTGVVVITDQPSQETIRDALDLGIIDYVPKPFTPSVLIDVIKRSASWLGKQLPSAEKNGDDFTPEMIAKLDRLINQYKNKPGSSIPVLQRAQEIVGYLPPPIQKRIARGLNIPVAEIHSIVSFYAFFTMKPRGENVIRVCMGTACYVKGIEKILEKMKEVLKVEVGGMTADKKFSLETVRCVGACGLAPVMLIGQNAHGPLTEKKAIDALNKYAPVSVNETPTEDAEVKEE